MGKEVQCFEKEIAEFLGVSVNNVVCVNTGTTALNLALSCLDIGFGDEVLVPTITFVASLQAISATGAKPVLCDVTLDSIFIDINELEKRLTSRTKAIMPVHYASSAKHLIEVYAFAKKYNLRVIEDAAHAFGCLIYGKKVGQCGDVVCFSFDGIKNITSGEGGAIVSNDQLVINRAKDARLLGVEKDSDRRYLGQRSWSFDVKRLGFRYHMSDIMAAIGREQLKKIDLFGKKRKEIVTEYQSNLNNINNIVLLEINYQDIIPHIFIIKVLHDKRDALQLYLEKKGIPTGIHYMPNHYTTFYKCDYSLLNADVLGKQILTLPLHPDLSIPDVHFVCENIKSFFK
jgi:dTDP-4-amino-4,6-dideoxygalactose transaminase